MTSRNIMWRTTECTQRGNCGFLAVHSIMKEKSAQAGEGGRCTPSPFHFVYHQVQSCSVRSSWEGKSAHLVVFNPALHCTESPINLFPKWNCAASFPIPTFMYLWVIYIFPGSVCLFGYSQIGRPILGIYESLTDNMEIGRQNIIILFWK